MAVEIILVLSLVAMCFSIGGAVFSLLFARRSVDPELVGDVNELTAFVQKVAKEQRRDRMREVRRGEKADAGESPAGPGLDAPKGWKPAEPLTTEDRKKLLRSKFYGRPVQ